MRHGTGRETISGVSEIPASTRPLVEAARKAIKAAAPTSREIVCQMNAPRSSRMMWKLYRYADEAGNVCGIGTFADHANLFFYRGRELDDGSGLLQGAGKEMRSITLRAPADAERPAVKRMVRSAFKLGGKPVSSRSDR